MPWLFGRIGCHFTKWNEEIEENMIDEMNDEFDINNILKVDGTRLIFRKI
jgi:hypothetical protein